jgi:cysteinyl-tRNA synthetase
MPPPLPLTPHALCSYVRNFTDVDDKIIRRAAEVRAQPACPHLRMSHTPLLINQLSVPCDVLTERYIAEFHADVASLRCLPPNLEPRATAHVPDIVALIQRIIANGHAYALPGGDVYFEVASLPGYGRLSRRGDDDNRAGERVAVDARKRGPADFALWKVREI